MNDYRHYNQYYWMNEWMNECMRVYFITVNCKTKVSYLKLITFSWYVDDDLVVWFSGNLEEWNLTLKLPGAFSFRRSFTNKIFWSTWSPLVLVYSFHTSVFQLEHLRGANLLFLLLFLEVFPSFWNFHFLIE